MNSSRVQFSFRVLWYVQLLMQTPPTVDSLGKRKKKIKSNAQKPPKFSTTCVPPDERVVEQEHDSPKISEPVQQEQHKWHLNNLKSAIPSQFHVARVSLSHSLDYSKLTVIFLLLAPRVFPVGTKKKKK